MGTLKIIRAKIYNNHIPVCSTNEFIDELVFRRNAETYMINKSFEDRMIEVIQKFGNPGEIQEKEEPIDKITKEHIEEYNKNKNNIKKAKRIIAKKIRKAEKIKESKAFEKLHKGKRADAITYNTMLTYCAVNKNLKDALQIYEMMKSDVRPNIVTINTLLDIYIRTGNYQEAWQLFDSMKGVKADKYTYSILMKALIYHKNGYEKAMRLMGELKVGMQMDEILFNSVG